MEKDRDNWDENDLNSYTVHVDKVKTYLVEVNAKSPSDAQDIVERWSLYWDTIVKLDTWEKPTKIDDEVWPQVIDCKLLDIVESVKGVSTNG